MGMRFRKSFGSKGFKVNVSKSGIGYSVGGKGFRYTKKAGGGIRTTASIPGTGISYVKNSKTGKKIPVYTNTAMDSLWAYKFCAVLGNVCGWIILALALLLMLVDIGIGITFTIISVVILLLSKKCNKVYKENTHNV